MRARDALTARAPHNSAVNIDEVQTFVVTTSIIGQGRTPDAKGHITFHITVGPSGKAAVEFEKARFTCR